MKLIKRSVMFLSITLAMSLQAVTVTLKDDQQLSITEDQFEKLKKASVTINNMAEDFGGEVDNLLLTSINRNTFEIILEYLKKNAKEQHVLLNDQPYESLYTLLEAANYLDIQSLQNKLTDVLAERFREMILKKNLLTNLKTWTSIPLSPDLKKELAKKIITAHMPLILSLITLSSQKVFEETDEKNIKLTTFSPIQCALLTTDKISIFNLETEKRWGTLDKNFGVDLMKFSNNGKLFFLGFQDGTLKGYETSDQKGKKLFERAIVGRMNIVLYTLGVPKRNFYDLAIDTEKKIIAVATRSPNVILISSENPDNIVALLAGHAKEITSVLFHPREQILVSGSKDTTIKIWDTEKYSLIKTLQGHNGRINALTFNADGSILFSAGADKKIIIWQMSDFSNKAEYTMTNPITHLIFDDEKEILYAADNKGNLLIIKIPDGRLLKTISISAKNKINAIGFLGKESLLTGVRGEAVRKWDLSPLTKIQSLSLEAVFLFLLVAEQGFGILEKHKALLEPIYQSLSDEQKEWLKSGKK